jgi:hypothetical protein
MLQGRFHGFYNNTLLHELDIHKGSQWALHNGTLYNARIRKGGLWNVAILVSFEEFFSIKISVHEV